MTIEPSLFSRVLGAGVAALGLYFLGMAAGVFEIEPGRLHAPVWVLGVVGIITMAVGIALLTSRWSQLRLIMVAFILFGFIALSAWMVFWVDPESISGGLPFISAWTNGIIAKILVGTGFLFYPAMLKQLFLEIRNGSRKQQ